jgi:hypothetical protein
MLDFPVRLLRTVAPSLLSDIKSALSSGRRLARKSRIWKWTKAEITPEGAAYKIQYSGTEAREDEILLALRRKAIGPQLQAGLIKISEFPIAQSLRVPLSLDMEVPLNASLEQILEGYGEKLRRVVLQQLPHAELVQAISPDEIAFADNDMLRPYAISRHGPNAAQIPIHEVTKLSRQPYGRLHILKMNGEPVACHLGAGGVRKGRSYWTAVRFGYVRSVFEDPKRLHEINSTNVYLATKFGKEFGADFYSLGMSLGSPDNGLLHWKRRRGGILSATTCPDWFYVRPPEVQVPTFFWGGPLFAMRDGGRKLSLHVGVPGEIDEAVLIARYREMHFRGIEEVIIHHEVSTPQTLLDKAAALLTQDSDARVIYIDHAR